MQIAGGCAIGDSRNSLSSWEPIHQRERAWRIGANSRAVSILDSPSPRFRRTKGNSRAGEDPLMRAVGYVRASTCVASRSAIELFQIKRGMTLKGAARDAAIRETKIERSKKRLYRPLLALWRNLLAVSMCALASSQC